MKSTYLLLRFIGILLIPTVSVSGSILLTPDYNPKVSGVREGRITDENGKPLDLALIQNINTGQHAHSLANGRFTIAAQTGDTLRVSYLGYETSDQVVPSEQTSMAIQMQVSAFLLENVTISPAAGSVRSISNIDQQVEPVKSSQEILRKVPGLFIGQHAGGGKAEQLFLRGFDIDHGTDILLSVDGMPVNMVSHAHGQGYADLHFVIPEIIETINFEKGPYEAQKGNFSTAGFVDFSTKKGLEENLIKLEAGQFNTKRFLAMYQLVDQKKHQSYIASEYLASDGPFESPQGFYRYNVMGKYNLQQDKQHLSVSASTFGSQWDASGQIPQRAVDAGQIGRFGAIDDTEGGKTSRSNIQLQHTSFLSPRSSLSTQAYYSYYDFELYSNFTFFLVDSINGDQIRQKESRNMAGFSSVYTQTLTPGRSDLTWKAGAGLRVDKTAESELSYTLNRNTTINPVQLGDIQETNSYLLAEAELTTGNWVLNAAIRGDFFDFGYINQLSSTYDSQRTQAHVLSPKAKLAYNGLKKCQVYAKAGIGFHSNDTRLILEQTVGNSIPKARGIDLGFVWKPMRNLLVHAAAWRLFLEQEFVYVGDAGIVEPGGETLRKGIDLSMQYQLADRLFLYQHMNASKARALGEDPGADLIPLAPTFTATGGMTWEGKKNGYASLGYRHLAARPANEDGSITAPGYTLLDATIGYRCGLVDVGISVENLLNTEWNEAQFATESRLKEESKPVEELHFTPGSPFALRARVAFLF